MSFLANPVILYRDGREEMGPDELKAAQLSFRMVRYRTQVKAGNLVIGRYSVLPFYKELSLEVEAQGARLINSPWQHEYVADLGNWVMDLGSMTPMTWDRLEHLPEEGPFVLKGATNSKKFQWSTHMFAKDRRAAGDVYSKLQEDGLLSSQKIYIRKYVPLLTYEVGLAGLPVTHEFRIFVCYGRVVSIGFYWSSHLDVVEEKLGAIPTGDDIPEDFLNAVLFRIGTNVNFYAVDVAKTASGEWIVVEVNDGQMAGLSENDPLKLYGNLREAIRQEEISPRL